ncbi:unnamed protein product [Closterium sp. NIES-54]
MYITLYFIVTCLRDSLRAVSDHFLALDPTYLTVDLLEKHLLAAETSVVAVGAAHGTPRTPFFEGCSPSPLALSYVSAATVDILVGVVVVEAVEAVEVAEVVVAVGVVAGVGGFNGGRGGSGGGGGGGGGGSRSGGGGSGGGRGGAVQRGGDHTSQTCGKLHTQHSCFSRLDDAWHAEFGDKAEHPRWLELLRSGVDIFALDYDAMLLAMYALSVSAEGDCYLCVPPDPGIEATALDASESALPSIAPAEALHTFTLDSGASRCFFRDSTTLTPLPAHVPVRLAVPSGSPVLARSSTILPCLAVPYVSLSGLHLPSFSMNVVSIAALQDAMVTTTTPRGQRVSICTCTRMGRHLAKFTRRPGSSMYTLANEPPQVAASGQTLLWHHRLRHPSLPHLCGMHSRLLVSGLPRSLLPLPPSPAPPCLPCVEGRQRAAPHSSSFPHTTAPLQTLHMDVWGPARISGQDRKRYFLLVVDDYTCYTTVFPLRNKGEFPDFLIPWIRAVRLQLRERFRGDLPILCLHSDRGGEFSSDLLRDFCRGEGIFQSFTLPASPQQNGVAERHIGLVMEVAHISMIHAAAPHFLWPFAVRYAAHQLNLWPYVSLPETSPTLRWTGNVGDASVFRVWGSRAFVRDTSADKLSSRAIPYVFLCFPPDAPGWQFYQPTLCRVLPSQDVTFDESVPFYRLFPYRIAPLPPPAALPCSRSPSDRPPPPPQGPAPSGVSQVDPLNGTVPVEFAVDSGAARGAATGGAAFGGAVSWGAEPASAEPEGAEPEGVESEGVESGGAELGGAEPGGTESEGAESGGAEPRGVASAGGPAVGGSAAGGTGARGTGATSLGGARVIVGAGGAGAASPRGARTRGDGAGGARAGDSGAGGTGVGGAGARGARVGDSRAGGNRARGAGAGGAVARDPGAGGTGAGGFGAGDPGLGGASAGSARASGPGAGGTVQRRPFFVPPPSSSLPPPDSPDSPLSATSPYAEQTNSLTERREPESRPALPVRAVCTGRRVPRPRPPSVPGTHIMALRPSSVPLRVPLLSPPASSLAHGLDHESELARAAIPTVPRLLATVVTDPSFESTVVSALVAKLVDFATDCRLEYAASLVAESVSDCPPSVRDPDTLDIPTAHSYAEAITGPYSSQWETAMDAEMASWKSTGTYVDAVPPPRANIVGGMWIFRGVDFFQTFSPTPKMTTLRVLLHVATQRDYELHSLDFSTAFLQGSLHEEIWPRRPPGFTGSFPASTQWSLRRPVYGLYQVPREWHETQRMMLAALGIAPSTGDPSLFLRSDTSLSPFYVLVYVDNLVFTTTNTEALTLVKSEL